MQTKKTVNAILMLMISLSFTLSSCLKEDPGPNAVYIYRTKFYPSTLNVSVGTTVTWTNKNKRTHTVSTDNGSIESGDIKEGQTFTYTFSSAGTCLYSSKYGSGMIGIVNVQ